jgi:hypothetical protein
MYMCTLYSDTHSVSPSNGTKMPMDTFRIRRGILVLSMLLIISSQVNYKDGTFPGGF